MSIPRLDLDNEISEGSAEASGELDWRRDLENILIMKLIISSNLPDRCKVTSLHEYRKHDEDFHPGERLA